MGILEDVASMSNQGVSEEGIVTNLREKGISPKEIKDALNQLKIKNAVSEYESGNEKNLFKAPTEENTQKQESYPPQPQNYSSSQQGYALQEQESYPQPGQNYSSFQQEYAPQESYGNYPSSGGVDANTIIELSEQVFSEKIKVLQKDLDSFNEFKSLNQVRLENLNDRLKRIEVVFDKLQIAILEKIGSYGQNLEVIKKEMNMVQDSFSKIVEPMVDRAEKKQEEKVHYSSVKKNSKKK
jgi:hypothetical protein